MVNIVVDFELGCSTDPISTIYFNAEVEAMCANLLFVFSKDSVVEIVQMVTDSLYLSKPKLGQQVAFCASATASSPYEKTV